MYATVDTDAIGDAMARMFNAAKRAERDARELGLHDLARQHNTVASTCDGLARDIADAIRFTTPDFDRGDFVRRVRDFAAIDNAD